MAEELHSNDNQQPGLAGQSPSRRYKRKGGCGGRRPRAGAPRGNLNGFKHGRRSRQLANAVAVLVANDKVRDTLLALGRQAGLKQAKAEDLAARFFVNVMTKGVKITNREQARAITDLIREMQK